MEEFDLIVVGAGKSRPRSLLALVPGQFPELVCHPNFLLYHLAQARELFFLSMEKLQRSRPLREFPPPCVTELRGPML